jgi:hypothetical protein
MLFLTYIQGPVVNEWVKGVNTWLRCYGRLAVVSDLDGVGFALNVDKELRGSAVL